MIEDYCLWTVAPKEKEELAQETVSSSRAVGIFKDFHIWTDGTISDADVHELGEFDATSERYKLTYMRNSVSRLRHQYFVWLAPGTRFTRDPGSVLRVLRRSPLHVPLTFELLSSGSKQDWCGTPGSVLCREMRRGGVHHRHIFAGHTGFFVVHRDAVDTVFDLAFSFYRQCENLGIYLPCDPLLAYACQMLSGDSRLHHFSHAGDLWLPRAAVSDPEKQLPAILG